MLLAVDTGNIDVQSFPRSCQGGQVAPPQASWPARPQSFSASRRTACEAGFFIFHPMAAAFAIGMDEHLARPAIVARPVRVIETLAALKAGDARRMEYASPATHGHAATLDEAKARLRENWTRTKASIADFRDGSES
jgi:hypothetical protein